MKKFYLFFLYFLLFASCEQTIDPFEGKLDLLSLTTNKWYTDSFTIYPGSTSLCEYDNIFSFSETGEFVVEQGDLNCLGTESKFFTGTWSLIENTNQIEILGWGWGENIWFIENLTQTNLELKNIFVDNSGVEQTVVYNLVQEPRYIYSTNLDEGTYIIKPKFDDLNFVNLASNNTLNISINPGYFKIFRATNGNYYIRPAAVATEIASQNVDNYESQGIVGLWYQHGGINQRWTFQPTVDGYFRIKNLSDNKMFESSSLGQQIQIRTQSNSDKQQFRFFKVLTNRFEAGGRSQIIQYNNGSGCTWSVEMIAIYLKFRVENNIVNEAFLIHDLDEKVLNGSCTSKGTSLHQYTFLNGSVVGDQVTINFIPTTQNTTKCNVTFNGRLNDNMDVIEGTLNWTRIGVNAPLNYSLSMPIRAIR